MKNFHKAFLLLAVAFFAACSSDDSAGTQSDGIRVKKITYTTHEDGETHTSVGNFNYSGNVLESVLSGTARVEFIYSGNKVMETKHYSNNVLSRTNTYEYDGDKLTYVTSNQGERNHYTYTGSTLSGITYQLFDEDVWDTFKTESFAFSQNNLTQKTQTTFSGGTFESRSTYTFDDKNNPTKGMNPYLRMTLNVPGIHFMSNNNAVFSQVFSPASSTSPSAVYVYQFVYNADNYPTSIIVSDGLEVISETAIEYQ